MKVCANHALRSASRLVTVLTVLLVGSSVLQCVYFNTFYNARRSFGEAEKKRKEAERAKGGERGSERRGRGGARSYQQLYD